jgi:hypothetical protein
VAYPKDKAQHFKQNDVLIDDNEKNCAEWKAAGGIAIHHISAADTIRQLKALDHHKIGRVFVDLDGVMADYNKAYAALGGKPDDKGGKKVNVFKTDPNYPHFYLHLDLMHDAMVLWHYLTTHSHVHEAFEHMSNTVPTPNLVETFETMDRQVQD